MSLYVGNLSYDVTKEDLLEVFKEYGSVGRVSMPTDRETGRFRGFAFVEMSSEAEEDAAIAALDGGLGSLGARPRLSSQALNQALGLGRR
jgi:RNA recognition motif-containing protein